MLLVEEVHHNDGAASDQGDDEDDEEDVEQQGGDIEVLGGGAVTERPAVVAEDFAVPRLWGGRGESQWGWGEPAEGDTPGRSRLQPGGRGAGGAAQA